MWSKLIHNILYMSVLFSKIYPTKCLSATEPYSFRIRSIFVTDKIRFRIRIRTLSAPTPYPEKIWLQTWFHYYSNISAPFSPLVASRQLAFFFANHCRPSLIKQGHGSVLKEKLNLERSSQVQNTLSSKRY